MCVSSGIRSITCHLRVDDDGLQELRWHFERGDLAEARRDRSRIRGVPFVTSREVAKQQRALKISIAEIEWIEHDLSRKQYNSKEEQL
jgi:hypothetical protein